MRYRLRLAAPHDAKTIVSWFTNAPEARLWGGPDVADPLTEDWLAEEFVSVTRVHYVLAEPHGRPCGLFALVDRGESVHLARVAVAPALRASGLGKVLVGHALAQAASAGARAMTLHVYERNAPARRLYETCGFRETSRARSSSMAEGMLTMAVHLERPARM